MKNYDHLQVGARVWRLATEAFEDPTAPKRWGTVARRYTAAEANPAAKANWSNTNQDEWWRFDVKWDDDMVSGIGYFACGLNPWGEALTIDLVIDGSIIAEAVINRVKGYARTPIPILSGERHEPVSIAAAQAGAEEGRQQQEGTDEPSGRPKTLGAERNLGPT